MLTARDEAEHKFVAEAKLMWSRWKEEKKSTVGRICEKR